MKIATTTTVAILLGTAVMSAVEIDIPVDTRSPTEIHHDGSAKLSERQDELSADVQQLVIEQTHPKVIELLREVEDIMDETTERLIDTDTGGGTIAAQTEIIEKIHAAAKARQGQGKGQSSGAMMDMLERMMGKKVPGDGKKPGQGEGAGDQAGTGNTGGPAGPNTATTGDAAGKQTTRRVPKSSGTSNQAIPSEFQKALDAYNRGMTEKLK